MGNLTSAAYRAIDEDETILNEIVAGGPDLAPPTPLQASTTEPISGPDLAKSLPEAREAWNADFERRYVVSALEQTRGNVAAAARLARVDRRYFHRLIERHRLR